MLHNDSRYEDRSVCGPINMKHHISPIAQPGISRQLAQQHHRSNQSSRCPSEIWEWE